MIATPFLVFSLSRNLSLKFKYCRIPFFVAIKVFRWVPGYAVVTPLPYNGSTYGPVGQCDPHHTALHGGQCTNCAQFLSAEPYIFVTSRPAVLADKNLSSEENFRLIQKNLHFCGKFIFLVKKFYLLCEDKFSGKLCLLENK